MNTPISDLPIPRRRDISRRRILDGASLLSLAAALALIFATGVYGARGARPSPPPPIESEPIAAVIPTGTVEPTRTRTPTATPVPTATATATPVPEKVAIVVGHRNNDSGAVCEIGERIGLQEVQVTSAVAVRVTELLRNRGYEVLDLDEFDSRQNGLQADALISLHVDSCVSWEGTTGFKVARAVNSAIPDQEDRFVACMNDEYGRATGLSIHPGSITHNMTNYHVFRRIDPQTPAIIIELGFLYHDQEVLTEGEEVMTEGLVRGITCFLRQSP